MTRLTTFVLAHKRIVLFVWLFLAVVGFATIGKTTGRLSTSFNIPGKAFHTDTRIEDLYHSGGFEPPIVLTATAPAGTSPQEAAQVEGQLFTAAAGTAVNSRLADQANTGAKLTTTNGQTAYALVFVPLLKGGFSAKDPAVAMRAAMASAAPAGWQSGVTGLAELESGSGGGSGGTNTLTETLLGGAGALFVLVFVFASFIALIPLLMAL
ncbi:MAG: MMPL family transporter, partial [Acidimicrobiales bacterium]